MRARRGAQALAQGCVADQPLERVRKAAGVARFEQQAGALLLDQLGNAPERRSPEARGASRLDRVRLGCPQRYCRTGPWFDSDFSLVDAVFGPVFRYFDVFDRIGDFEILPGKPKVTAWRKALAARPSIAQAVGTDYEARLARFLSARNSHLSTLMP